jgi:beta-lactam-binding protein with PASTA domain
MPDLVGRPLSEVERWIEISGFRRGAIRRIAAAGAPETIVGQLPPAGHPISSKGVIELTVAR